MNQKFQEIIFGFFLMQSKLSHLAQSNVYLSVSLSIFLITLILLVFLKLLTRNNRPAIKPKYGLSWKFFKLWTMRIYTTRRSSSVIVVSSLIAIFLFTLKTACKSKHAMLVTALQNRAHSICSVISRILERRY